MASAARVSGSFRDPSGFVFSSNGVVYRQVSETYATDYAHLISSGLYDKLAIEGWLLPHEELDLRLGFTPAAHKVLRPAQLAFVSHPYEWSFGQLKDAALATLRIQRIALAHGMSLKDASVYNIQLHEARSTLIDTLSFEAYVPNRPWVAYRQFCQHFLAPLALMSRVDIRLSQLLRTYIDGIPLDLASRLLPFRTVFMPGLGLHVHAHALTQHRFNGQSSPAILTSHGMSLKSLQSLITHLEQTIEGLLPRSQRTEWDDYYCTNNNYGDSGLASKASIIREFLASHPIQTVWDLGANDGRFSRLALHYGSRAVVAWDIDPNCVEANYQTMVARRECGHFPLLLDLTNPSPAIGWANQERLSLAERGPADVVLALGLIHHLAISNNLPLSHIASYLRSLGRRLIIEWVPKQDSQVKKLLATRRDIFPDYDQSAFEAAFAREFCIMRKAPVEGTCRTLYLLQALAGSCHSGENGIPG